ncbi:MAG TPA: glycosyltransferase [bacterium]|nr:glycosyltransferase [bacterium]
MNVSVIIPTHNRSQVLLRCLNALIEQRRDFPGSFEIVVVDDGSTDGTAQAVNAFRENCPVELRLVQLGSQAGPAAARNRGLAAARFQIVIFIGDDIIVEPGFLRRHCAMHRRFRGGSVAVLGYTTWHPELKITPFMGWLEDAGEQFDYGFVEREGPTWQHFYTSNISLKRRFMLENGVFDEDFKQAAFEDTELGFRLFERGLRIVYCKDALAYHLHPDIEPMEYFRDGIFQRGVNEVVFQWKHRRIAELFDRDISYWRRVLLSAAMPDACPSIDHLRLVASAKNRPSRLFAEHFGASIYESLASFYRGRGAADKVVERFPNLAVAGERLARALEAERASDVPGSLDEFWAAREAEPRLMGLVLLCADAFFRHGRFDQAERLLSDALEMSPRHPYVNLRMGELLRRLEKDPARAGDCYQAALEGEMLDVGSQSVAQIGLGLLEMSRNAHKAALRWFRRACAMGVADANITASCLVHSAEACVGLGRREEGHRLLDEVGRVGGVCSSTRAYVAFLRAELWRQQGRLAQALRMVDLARAHCVRDDELNGQIELKKGQIELERARKDPTKAVRRFLRRMQSLIDEGRCSQKIGFSAVIMLNEARAFSAAAAVLKSLSKVIDLDSRFLRLALAYKRIGLLTNAEDMMSSLEFLPASEQAEWHLSAASLLLEMGYDQDAEDEVRSALTLRPDWPYANYVLGSIMESRHRLDEAKARFEAVLEHRDTVGDDQRSRLLGGAHYHLAYILEQEGQGEETLLHLEACLELIPRHRKAMDLMESLTSAATLVPG